MYTTFSYFPVKYVKSMNAFPVICTRCVIAPGNLQVHTIEQSRKSYLRISKYAFNVRTRV